MQYRDTMQRDEWMTLVKETKSCILENPQDFFGENLPAKKITAKVIQLVFDGFIKDMHIRHVQAFRKVY